MMRRLLLAWVLGIAFLLTWAVEASADDFITKEFQTHMRSLAFGTTDPQLRSQYELNGPASWAVAESFKGLTRRAHIGPASAPAGQLSCPFSEYDAVGAGPYPLADATDICQCAPSFAGDPACPSVHYHPPPIAQSATCPVDLELSDPFEESFEAASRPFIYIQSPTLAALQSVGIDYWRNSAHAWHAPTALKWIHPDVKTGAVELQILRYSSQSSHPDARLRVTVYYDNCSVEEHQLVWEPGSSLGTPPDTLMVGRNGRTIDGILVDWVKEWKLYAVYDAVAFPDTDGDDYPNPVDGDFNQNGFVDGSDYTLFLADYATGVDSGIGSDMNGSGAVDATDFNDYFLPQFSKGTPGF